MRSRYDQALDALFETTLEPDGTHNASGHMMRQESYVWVTVMEKVFPGGKKDA